MTEATYDYSEADVSWSDTDPTVPGPVGMPPGAGFPPAPHDAVIAGVPMTAVSIGMTLPRGPSLLVRGAVLVGVVLATVIVCRWAFGQRGSVPIARVSVSPVSPPAPVAEVLPLAPLPPPVLAPLPAVVVQPPSAPAVTPVVESSRDIRSEHRHRFRGSRHRSHRHEVGSWSSVGDWSELEGARRGRSLRLRPIDVADPFAP